MFRCSDSQRAVLGRLFDLPRVPLFSAATALEWMPNLTQRCGGAGLFVKRDDALGFAFGGNKVRQLEFYLGDALAQGADTILITGAVQSNFVRLAAAASNRLGLQCHIQLEERVQKDDVHYRQSGNVLIDRLLGAVMHSYPEGEDEYGADRRLGEIARDLTQCGRRPYIIPLSPDHPPHGALGYVVAAGELLQQLDEKKITLDKIVLPSGSGNTHAGLLFGLRALGCSVPVHAICVRRNAEAQFARIKDRCHAIAKLLAIRSPVQDTDILLDDRYLSPGYGLPNEPTMRAILWGARSEALMLDPAYSGKSMAGLIEQAKHADPDAHLLFWHTGGMPGLFAYQDDLYRALET